MHTLEQISILLVEDDPITARVEQAELENIGYSVHHITTGEEAVDRALECEFSLILMDIDLGKGMDGTQAAERILQTKEMPILFLSSHTEPEIVERTEGISSYGYVVKGTGITVLNASIKMALRLFGARQKLRDAEQMARTNGEKYRNLFENITEEVHFWKLVRTESGLIRTWRLEEANPAALAAWGRSREDIIGKTTEEIWPDSNPVQLFMPVVQKIFSEGRPRQWETYFPGTGQTLLMTSVAFGEYFISTGIDVSDRNRAEMVRHREEKELLLRETYHRLKNNVASIEGLLSAQADASSNPEVKLVLHEAVGRLASIRALYDGLLVHNTVQRVSMQPYLQDLIDSIVRAFAGSSDISIEKKLDDFALSAEKATAIGIALNELLTNAMKYGLGTETANSVSVTLRRQMNGGQLIVQDYGPGMPEDFILRSSRGFGLSMVHMLARQLGGTFQVTNTGGAQCVLSFPTD